MPCHDATVQRRAAGLRAAGGGPAGLTNLARTWRPGRPGPKELPIGSSSGLYSVTQLPRRP
eukprot:356968-Hanusia_phi.AAC.2